MNKLKRISREIIDLLKSNGKWLVTAESCTGGGIGQALTAVPGSSSAYWGGFITYDNQAKIKLLDVPADVLEQNGAVSAETALSMAEGALKKTGADFAVAVSGIAGPGGGSAEKPVGTVILAIADKNGHSEVSHYRFTGNRNIVRSKSVDAALEMVKKAVNKAGSS